jgi:hypothetical protein
MLLKVEMADHILHSGLMNSYAVRLTFLVQLALL